MDQKHAMLYPDMNMTNNESGREQRVSASAAMGLPLDLPPSYDMAVTPTTRTSAPIFVREQDVRSSTHSQGVPSPLLMPQGRRSLHSLSETHQVPPLIVIQSNPTSSQMDSEPPAVGPNPCTVLCPTCGVNRTTRMRWTPNHRAHFCALLLCIVGWCCCACLLPYCMKSCRSGHHYCSECNTFLGVWEEKFNFATK